MKTITTNIYLFNELSEEIQKQLIEKTMNQNRDEFWSYEFNIKESFAYDLENTGFHVEEDQMYYDLSYNQGSGASFDGCIYLPEFMKNNPKDYTKREIKIISNLINNGLIESDVIIKSNSFSNHYYHEKTRYVDEIEIDYNFEYGKTLEKLFTKIIENIEFDRLELCQKLYNIAENQLEYCSSEEYAIELLNEYNEDYYTDKGVLVQ